MTNVVSMADFRQKKSDQEGRDWVAQVLDSLDDREADPLLVSCMEAGYEHIAKIFNRDTYNQVIQFHHAGNEGELEEKITVFHRVESIDVALEVLSASRSFTSVHAIRDISEAEATRRMDTFRALSAEYANSIGDPNVRHEWGVYTAFATGFITYLITTCDSLLSDMVVEDGVLSFALRTEDSTYNVYLQLGLIMGLGSGQMEITDAVNIELEKTADQ